jgi:hypothetical protein
MRMEKFFSIGAINISLTYDPASYDITLDKALENFSIDPVQRPDIRFRIDTESPFPSVDACRRIFTASPDGLWTIFEDQNKTCYLIVLQNVMRDSEPYKIIRADRMFTDFIIYDRPAKNNMLSPLEYPLAELAISGYLNLNKIGIILHSACIAIRGKSYLFAGESGSGKSTISEIWRRDKEAEVFTDERVILRELQNELWAFGTPWHGTSNIHKNMGAGIVKIFFIKHGKNNRAIPLSKTEAASRLMARCFPSFWSREGMAFTLDFCARVAERRECYHFQFLPDQSAAGFLKQFDQREHIT